MEYRIDIEAEITTPDGAQLAKYTWSDGHVVNGIESLVQDLTDQGIPILNIRIITQRSNLPYSVVINLLPGDNIIKSVNSRS